MQRFLIRLLAAGACLFASANPGFSASAAPVDIVPTPVRPALEAASRADTAGKRLDTASETAGKAEAADSAGTVGKAASQGRRAAVIPVEEQVDFGLKAFLERAVKEALETKPDVIVFKVNTYGGELQSAFDIVDIMTGITQCSTYAYVEQKAISAGALISLANNRIAMGRATTIGDCAPITQGQEGIVMLGEKIQSPLRAKFRTLAERNGYPTLLTEAMVTADLGVVAAVPGDSLRKALAEGQATARTAGAGGGADSARDGPAAGIVTPDTPYRFFTAKQWDNLSDKDKQAYKSHKTVAAEGQLLTLTDQEAREYGLSQGSFGSFDEFLASKGWTKSGEWATTWSEDMVRVIGTFAPVLMLIGFGALYLEFKTPGLSLFGFIGLACLGIVFGSKFAVGLADHTELLLLLAGMAFILAEMYLFPGTFIAGGLGVILLIVALTLSLQDYTLPDPEMPWEAKDMVQNIALTVGTAGLAVLIPVFAARWLLPNLPAGMQVISGATLAEARAVAPEALAVAQGSKGTSRTALRPTGKAQFGDRTLEVSSRGEFIEAGRPLEVVRVEGNRVVVRESESA